MSKYLEQAGPVRYRVYGGKRARTVRGLVKEAHSEGACLDRVLLIRANLRNLDLLDADMPGAVLSGADLRRTDLRNANLAYADLGRTDLRGADLRYSYLRGASFVHADLRGADLRGANLRDTRFCHVVTDNTTRMDPQMALSIAQHS